MGYDIHITRENQWGNDAAQCIREAEWLSAVDADPELKLEGIVKIELSSG